MNIREAVTTSNARPEHMDVERVKSLEERLRIDFCVDTRELRELTRILRVNLRILAARIEKSWRARDWEGTRENCDQVFAVARNIEEKELAHVAEALVTASNDRDTGAFSQHLPEMHAMLEEIGVFDDELLMHD